MLHVMEFRRMTGELLTLFALLLTAPTLDAVELVRVGIDSDGALAETEGHRALVRRENVVGEKYGLPLAPQELQAALREKGTRMLTLVCKAMFRTYFIDTKIGSRGGFVPNITKQLSKQNYCGTGAFNMYAVLSGGNHERSFWTNGQLFEDSMLKISSDDDLAAAWAHSRVWNYMVRQNTEAEKAQAKADTYSLMLEADAILRDDFQERLKSLKERMGQSSFPDADIIYLGTCDEQCPPDWEQGIDVGGSVFVAKAFHPDCSHSYLLSAAGAAKLTASGSPKMAYPVGKQMLSSFLEGAVKSLVLCPPITRLASQPEFPNVVGMWQDTRHAGQKSWAVKFDQGV